MTLEVSNCGMNLNKPSTVLLDDKLLSEIHAFEAGLLEVVPRG